MVLDSERAGIFPSCTRLPLYHRHNHAGQCNAITATVW